MGCVLVRRGACGSWTVMSCWCRHAARPYPSTSPGKNSAPADTNLVMALSTASGSAHRSQVVDGAPLCALVCTASAGVPGRTDYAEPFHTLGEAVSVMEVAAAIAAVRRPDLRRHG
jgi:hypothetical protein